MAKRNSRRLRGVTLIEILVAMIIMAIGLFMVYNIFPMGFATSFRSKNKTIATQLAQQKLESIIHNKEAVDCKSDHSGQCLYIPIPTESDDSYVSANPYMYWSGSNTDFDCRYFFGKEDSNGNVIGGTYCTYSTVDSSEVDSWKEFDDYALFWYKVQVMPVLDPALKFRDAGSLSKITVWVRGPVDSMDNWSANTDGSRYHPLPVEVVLSTFVANKYLASTSVDVSKTNSDSDFAGNGNVLYVDNIRNFTMFKSDNLDTKEIYDTGMVAVVDQSDGIIDNYKAYYTDGSSGSFDNDFNRDPSNTTQWNPQIVVPNNYYGLDNVMLALYNSDTGVWRYQTNKIIYICPDDSVSVNPQEDDEIPGYIVLLNNVYYFSEYEESRRYNSTYPKSPYRDFGSGNSRTIDPSLCDYPDRFHQNDDTGIESDGLDNNNDGNIDESGETYYDSGGTHNSAGTDYQLFSGTNMKYYLYQMVTVKRFED